MTTGPTFDGQLEAWIKDGPTTAPGEILDAVLAAVPATAQRRAALRAPWRTSPMTPFFRLLAGIAVAVAIAAGALLVVSRLAPGGVGAPPPVPASEVPSATPAGTPSAPASAAPTPTASPTPTEAATPGLCTPADLAARITLWEGAAGHRIADVDLTNSGSDPCIVETIARPQLVDATGSVLIDGEAPLGSSVLTIDPGTVLTSLVQDGNYCGPAPVAPVTVAFVQSDGSRIVATPFSPTDATVPPCLGSAGSAGDISMQPWARTR